MHCNIRVTSVVCYSLPLLVIQDGERREKRERERERERERALGPEVEFSTACLAVINVFRASSRRRFFFIAESDKLTLTGS